MNPASISLPPLRRQRYLLGRAVRQNSRRLLKALVRDGLVVASVIHCGAHLGQERHFYERVGARKVVWIEGSQLTFTQLRASLEAERTAGALAAEHLAVNALLFAEHGRELTLHGFSNEGQSNSVFHATETFAKRWPGLRETGQDETAISTTLDRVADSYALDGADLLVLDLQGAELEVLKGGRRTLAKAKAVICEVSKIPLYNGGALYPDVLAAFAAEGFIDLHRPHTSGDVLFLRKEILKK